MCAYIYYLHLPSNIQYFINFIMKWKYFQWIVPNLYLLFNWLIPEQSEEKYFSKFDLCFPYSPSLWNSIYKTIIDWRWDPHFSHLCIFRACTALSHCRPLKYILLNLLELVRIEWNSRLTLGIDVKSAYGDGEYEIQS